MDPNELLIAADAARERGDFESAAGQYERILRADSRNVAAGAGLGLALHGLGRPAQALPYLSRVGALNVNDPKVYAGLGGCYFQLGDQRQAIAAFQRSLELEPENIRTQLYLSHALMLVGETDACEACLRKVIATDPAQPKAFEGLSLLLSQLGRFDEAKEAARQAAILDPTNYASAIRAVVRSRVTKDDGDLIDRLRHGLKQDTLETTAKFPLEFALGKAMEDLGHIEQAANHYVRGNALAQKHGKDAGRRFDAEGHHREVDFIIQGYPDADVFASRPQGPDDERAVFIIGMMRSGTTLVEQILSSHPEIGGAGEVPFWIEAGPRVHHAITRQNARANQLATIANQYLDVLTDGQTGKQRVCDKLPQNYMNLGTLHTVLPKAKIIHCRRDPRDVCLSLFTTLFRVPPAFAFSAKDIAFAYREYLRIMEHWRTVLPAEQFLEVDYEEIVSNEETVARKMIAFLGLEWDDACRHPEDNPRAVDTPSQWQVRQPVYPSSIGRWRRFEPFMASTLAEWKFP